MLGRSACALVCLASLVAAVGCEGKKSSDHDGEGGRTSGGTVTGGTPSSGGSSGAGTVVLDPPGPGIACGDATCDEATEMCCADDWSSSSSSCSTSLCTGVAFRLGCDDRVDCPGQVCCLVNMYASVSFATECADECGERNVGIPVCKQADDCTNGEPCRAYTCDGNVFGLCTATPPMFCE